MLFCWRWGTLTRTMTITDMDLAVRLCEFLENEAQTCSIDYGCITPEYVSYPEKVDSERKVSVHLSQGTGCSYTDELYRQLKRNGDVL